MTNSPYRNSPTSKKSLTTQPRASANSRRKRARGKDENSDVLVSAVISSYLLTHLHQVLQRAEYGAEKDGRISQAANFAQLRKLLCMDARSMKDASAVGVLENDMEKVCNSGIGSKVA